MVSDANPPGPGADEERLAAVAAALVVRIDAAVPGWIERLVTDRVHHWAGEVPGDVAREAAAAGEAARAEVVPQVRALLGSDIDEQRANPLDLLRRATHHARVVLDRHGVPPVERDEFSERSFPDDVHDLAPATWSDIDPDLHEPGITWGAAKAFVHKARRRAEGRT